MRTFESVGDLSAAKGETIGQSDWVTITQEDVNLFADATGDHQWIHVDPERAAAGPFGTTIAHGYMTLSLADGARQRRACVEQAERLPLFAGRQLSGERGAADAEKRPRQDQNDKPGQRQRHAPSSR
ncbi:MAG: MaoC/PaaZ C-terminal domain-containing protein [Mycobacterium sp.]